METRNYRLADEAAMSIGPATFKSESLATAFEDLTFYWGQIDTEFMVLCRKLGKLDRSEVAVNQMNVAEIIASAERCAKLVILAEPGVTATEEMAERASKRWAADLFSPS